MMNSVEGTEDMDNEHTDEQLMDTVAQTLAAIAETKGDAIEIAKIIQNVIINERSGSLPNTDDVATLLAFLYYYRQENGGSAMWGGRRVDEAIAAACRISSIDETRLKDVFDA